MIGDQRRGIRDYDGRVTSGVESTPQNYLPFMRNCAEYIPIRFPLSCFVHYIIHQITILARQRNHLLI